MGDVLNEAIFEIAEEISESMGLCIPAPDLVKVAGTKCRMVSVDGKKGPDHVQVNCSSKIIVG